MSDFNITIPKLGESIQEGTITKLFVKKGDVIKENDVLFELATDKVDSEIPSPVGGKIKEIKCVENETYPVGEVVIIISTGESIEENEQPVEQKNVTNKEKIVSEESVHENQSSSQSLIEEEAPPAEIPGKREIEKNQAKVSQTDENISPEPSSPDKFFSPLVKNIAEKEGLSQEELKSIPGSGLAGRIQRNDVLKYLEEKKAQIKDDSSKKETAPESIIKDAGRKANISYSIGEEDSVIKMDRIRKIIADHMVMSKDIAAHVTTVVEADVTNLVLWRNRVKEEFQRKYNDKITFLPIITELVAKALTEFKKINASVDGDNVILRKHINIGIAVAKDDDTLIVPVIKDADTKNLLGLSREINGFGNSARNNKILPDQLQGGSFSITNFGSFKNIIGTPIINQPQVAILAIGLIEKKPAVIETPTGDSIVIRHKMYLSLSYDHRVIDGMLGGKFLRRIADFLENFDINREI